MRSGWRDAGFLSMGVLVGGAISIDWYPLPAIDETPAPTCVQRYGQVVGRQDCAIRNEACARGLDRLEQQDTEVQP